MNIENELDKLEEALSDVLVAARKQAMPEPGPQAALLYQISILQMAIRGRI